MDGRRTSKTEFSFASSQIWIVLCAILACALGAGVIAVGGGSKSQTLAAAVGLTLPLIAVVWFVLDLPVIALVRGVFVLAFFIKLEINLLKLDEVEDPSGFNISLAVVCAAILLIYDWLTAEDDDGGEREFPLIFALLLASLAICAALSVIYGGAGMLGVYSLWTLAGSVLITCALASHFNNRARVGELVLYLAAGLIFTGGIALSQFAFNFPSSLSFFGTGTEDELLGTQALVLSRAQAFLRTPTEMGWVVSSFLPLVIAPLICQVKEFNALKKILLAMAAVAGITAVILSLARGSWFGTLAALAILVGCGWWCLTADGRRKYLLSVGAATLLGALALVPMSGKIYERLTADDEGSAAIRIPLLEVAKRVIEDNPLVGVGLNNYRAAMTKYDETGIFVSQIFPNPVHNVFAHVAAEIGVPGGILFCLLIFAAAAINFQTMLGSKNDYLRFALALAVIAGLTAWILSAMKEPSSLGSARPAMRTLFFLFGVTLAVNRLPFNKNRAMLGEK